MAALDHNAFRGMLRSSTVKKVHAKNVIIDRGIMAALDHNAFRGMLRSSTVKKVRAQNVIVDREREKISTSSSGHKHAIGTEEETHKARLRRLPSRSSLTDFAHSALRQLLVHHLLCQRLCTPPRYLSSSSLTSQPLISLLLPM